MSVSETSLPRSLNLETIRGDFPIFDKPLPRGLPLVYLDNASSAQKPRAVLEKEAEVYESYYANAYRGVYQFGARVDEELEAARAKVQRFIGAAEPQEIVFTSGTTMAINLVAQAWGRKFLAPGDEIVVSAMEHHANLVPWQQVARDNGAILRFIELSSDGRLDLRNLDELLNAKTRLIAVTAMSNVLGTINPIDQIVAKAKLYGARVLVDAAQSVPHLATDVCNPKVDFLVFSGHKLFGPTGIGVLYGRRELLEGMDPFLYGGHMIEQVSRNRSTWAELPAKYEAGTLPIVQAIGLGAAVDYVNQIGFDAIGAHERRLLRHAQDRLAQVPGLQIYGPDVDHKGAIVSFTIERIPAEDLALLLDRRGVFVRHGHHCTMPLHDLLGVSATTRASFSIYNTLADVDTLIDAIDFAREKLRVA